MSRPACDEIRALLPAHLDGDLAPAEAAGVRGHLEACPSCREHLETLRLAVDAFRRLPELPPPASILAGVRERLHPVPWHRRIFARRPWLAGIPVGALATALVVLGVALFQARYPRLPQVAEQHTAPPLGVTRETVRDAAPAPAVKPVPRTAVETARKPAAAPAPQARPAAPPRREQAQGPRRAVPGDTQPSQGSERAIVNAPPEPFAGAPEPVPVPPPLSVPPPPPPATPQRTPPAALTPAPAPVTAPSTMAARVPHSIGVPPASAPEPSAVRPAAPTAIPGQRGQFRSIVDALVPRVAGDRAASLSEGPPSPGAAGTDPGAVTQRGAPISVTGQRVAGTARPSPDRPPEPQEEPQETIAGFTVLLAAGEDFDEIRQLVRHEGGRTVETRVLEPRARREAFAPHRSRAGLRGEVSRGWELTVRIPRRAVAGFAEALERRPGRLVLQRRTAPPAARGRPAEEQTLRITVLR